MERLPLQATPWVTQFSDPQDTARDLQTAFEVLDVGRFRGQSGSAGPFCLRAATLPYGEVVLTSFAGTGLHSHLRSESLAFFVLPGRGIGHYRLLEERIEVTAGATVGYLPPCEFQVTNTTTCGTLIGFNLPSLQRRIAAIGGHGGEAAMVVPELLRPRTLALETPRERFVVGAILDVLNLIDQAMDLTLAPPPAALALDDLILRSIALLLMPPEPARFLPPPCSLQRAVDLAMVWMRANLDRPISLTEIELQVSYGRRALQKGFRERVGCGPMQWLRRQRLEAAHGLIVAIAQEREAPLSITQVARRCGYLNLSAFSRDFAAIYGYPPSRLLRRR